MNERKSAGGSTTFNYSRGGFWGYADFLKSKTFGFGSGRVDNFQIIRISLGTKEKEEGRRKKEEGRRKKEEGRRWVISLLLSEQIGGMLCI